MKLWRERVSAGGERYMRAETAERGRNKLRAVEASEGLLVAAVVKGEACCHVNDPDYSREWWAAALTSARAQAGATESGSA